jgi:hypothetical protein
MPTIIPMMNVINIKMMALFISSMIGSFQRRMPSRHRQVE